MTITGLSPINWYVPHKVTHHLQAGRELTGGRSMSLLAMIRAVR